MIRICIVGDIGCGKSYVAKQFCFPIFNADFEVNKIYKKSRKCFKKLKRAFPNHIFSFPIKRRELFRIVKENKNNVIQVNFAISGDLMSYEELKITYRNLQFLKAYDIQWRFGKEIGYFFIFCQKRVLLVVLEPKLAQMLF